MRILIFALWGYLLITPGHGGSTPLELNNLKSLHAANRDPSRMLKLLKNVGQSLQQGTFGGQVRNSRGVSSYASSPYVKGIREGLISRGGFVDKQVHYQDAYKSVKCRHGELLNALGRCEVPEVNRKVFIFDGPDLPPIHAPAPDVPSPKVDYNVVFVRTPEQPKPLDPIVVPPPEKKTILYVLTKNEELEQQVIEAPDQEEDSPEVVYVNYGESDEDENTEIYGSLTIKDVLHSLQSQNSKVIHIGNYEDDGEDDGGYDGGDDEGDDGYYDDDDDDDGDFLRTYSKLISRRRGGKRRGYRRYGSFDY